MTAAARQISAASLRMRMRLTGPDGELKELGDTFDELLARLEASFNAQRQFIANAHSAQRMNGYWQQVTSSISSSTRCSRWHADNRA